MIFFQLLSKGNRFSASVLYIYICRVIFQVGNLLNSR